MKFWKELLRIFIYLQWKFNKLFLILLKFLTVVYCQWLIFFMRYIHWIGTNIFLLFLFLLTFFEMYVINNKTNRTIREKSILFIKNTSLIVSTKEVSIRMIFIRKAILNILYSIEFERVSFNDWVIASSDKRKIYRNLP
jgi:hypothetical protein